MKNCLTLFCAALLAITTRAQDSTSLVFEAKDAKITGGGKAKFETGPAQQNIGIWDSTNTVVSWTCPALSKGTYTASSPPTAASRSKRAENLKSPSATNVPASRSWRRAAE